MLNGMPIKVMCATDNRGVPSALFIHRTAVPKTLRTSKSNKRVLGSPRSEVLRIEHTPKLLLDIIA